MMTASHESAGATGDPCFTVPARAIMELSPESTPAWVRDLGPALAPAAAALHAEFPDVTPAQWLAEGSPLLARIAEAALAEPSGAPEATP